VRLLQKCTEIYTSSAEWFKALTPSGHCSHRGEPWTVKMTAESTSDGTDRATPRRRQKCRGLRRGPLETMSVLTVLLQI
jgi:hypothetical protein